jgi:hypothetical protein
MGSLWSETMQFPMMFGPLQFKSASLPLPARTLMSHQRGQVSFVQGAYVCAVQYQQLDKLDPSVVHGFDQTGE